MAEHAAYSGKKIIAQNRKARHEFFVEDNFEAGVELFGTEVKSIRMARLSFNDAYCYTDRGELFVTGLHISPYEKGNIFNKDPLRLKRLLMHKREILKLTQWTTRDGYTLVPLSVYLLKGRVKLEIGLCKGKKLYDKREAAADRDRKRESERQMRSYSYE
ncbi:SsrA-binding protein [Clostridia bacterium]|nr:SsrA-binding protein [Clostridia bacterium]